MEAGHYNRSRSYMQPQPPSSVVSRYRGAELVRERLTNDFGLLITRPQTYKIHFMMCEPFEILALNILNHELTGEIDARITRRPLRMRLEYPFRWLSCQE